MFFETDGDGLGKIGVGNGFDVGIDVAVEHIDDSSGISGEGRVVSDHDDGVALLVDGL